MLELYQMEHCPFCAKVRRTMEDLNLDFMCRTATKGSGQREMMVAMGGQEQVPFLVDTTDPSNIVKMYESDDIIRYLEETYKK